MPTTKPQIFENDPLTFAVSLDRNDDRLDCAWFNPVVDNKIEKLRKTERRDRKLVKLESIAGIQGGKRLPKGTVVVESEANNIPYVRATDVKDLKVNFDTALKIPKKIHQKIQNYQLQRNNVVITTVGTIGEVGILEEHVAVCDFTENVVRVSFNKDSVLPRFVLHFLDSKFGKMQMERFSVGSLQYKLSLSSCRNIEVYIPYKKDSYDASVQEKILKETYELLEEANRKREKGQKLIEQANSVVTERLSIPLPDEGEEVCFTHKVGEPATRLDVLFNNPFREKLIFSLKKYPSYKKLGELVRMPREETVVPADFYRLVELEQVDGKTGRITSQQEVLELGSKKILFKAGSILVAKLQPEKGKVAIVPRECDGAVGSSEFVTLMLESAKVSTEYLWAVLRSDYVLKQWKYELTGSSRMRISSTELKRTIIPIPNRNIQEEIVADIQKMISESDSMLQKSSRLYEKARERFISNVIE